MWVFPSLKCSKRTQNLVIFMSTFTTTFSVLWNKQIYFKLSACLFVCCTQQHFIKSTPCLFLLARNQRIELGLGGESHKNRISEKVKLFKRHNWHFRIVWSYKHHLASETCLSVYKNPKLFFEICLIFSLSFLTSASCGVLSRIGSRARKSGSRRLKLIVSSFF